MIQLRSRKLLFLLLIFALIVGAVGWLAWQKMHVPSPVTPVKEIHIHAGFQVYVDNQLQDFSDFKYMNFEPCTVHKVEEPTTPEHEQMEKAHLHDNVGDVVHVHREGATWGDLLQNLKFSYNTNKEVAGYIDGQKIPDILHQAIPAHKSVVIVIGDQSKAAEYAQKAVTLEHIQQIEQKSELCGSAAQ